MNYINYMNYIHHLNSSVNDYSNSTIPYDNNEILFDPVMYIFGSLILSVAFIRCLWRCNIYTRPYIIGLPVESDIRSSIIDDSRPTSDIESVNLEWIKVKNTTKKKNIIDKNISCCICLEKIKSNEEIGQLPCDHFFHFKCIQEWFNTNYDNKCPLCNKEISAIDIEI